MQNRIQKKLDTILQFVCDQHRAIEDNNTNKAMDCCGMAMIDIVDLQEELKEAWHVIPKTDDLGQVMSDGFTQGMYFGSQNTAEQWETIKANMLDTPNLFSHIYDVLEDLRNRDDFDYDRDGLAVEDFQDCLRNMKPIAQGDTP